jgi:hypothetical protein
MNGFHKVVGNGSDLKSMCGMSFMIGANTFEGSDLKNDKLATDLYEYVKPCMVVTGKTFQFSGKCTFDVYKMYQYAQGFVFSQLGRSGYVGDYTTTGGDENAWMSGAVANRTKFFASDFVVMSNWNRYLAVTNDSLTVDGVLDATEIVSILKEPGSGKANLTYNQGGGWGGIFFVELVRRIAVLEWMYNDSITITNEAKLVDFVTKTAKVTYYKGSTDNDWGAAIKDFKSVRDFLDQGKLKETK